MASEDWPILTVAECASSEPYSTQIGPFGEKIRAENYTPAGAPVLRGTNVNPDGRFHDDDFVFIDSELADAEFSKFVCEADDVILCHKGTLGKIGVIPKKSRFKKYIMGNSMMKVRCDRSKLEPLYLYYWLCSRDGQDYIFSRVSQVGVPQIQRPLTTLREAAFPLPPLAEQRGIAGVLGALDDKIELNRRMNATLEAMARALFQSWFVDFDPVRAKLDPPQADQPPGLDNATTELFPDSFEDSEFGKIPKGWTKSDIGAFAINHDARREPVKESDRKPGPYPYYGASGIVDHVDGYVFDGEYLLIAEDGENLRTRKTPVAFRAIGKFWVNNHAHVITGPTVGGTRFLLLSLERADIGGYLTGSTIPKLSQQSMNRIPFVLPSSALLDEFERVTDPMFVKIDDNRCNSELLATLRDALLPKLLSGELSVSDIARIKEVRK